MLVLFLHTAVSFTVTWTLPGKALNEARGTYRLMFKEEKESEQRNSYTTDNKGLYDMCTMTGLPQSNRCQEGGRHQSALKKESLNDLWAWRCVQTAHKGRGREMTSRQPEVWSLPALPLVVIYQANSQRQDDVKFPECSFQTRVSPPFSPPNAPHDSSELSNVALIWSHSTCQVYLETSGLSAVQTHKSFQAPKTRQRERWQTFKNSRLVIFCR